MHHAGDTSRPDNLLEQVSSITELSLETLETDMECRLQSWNLSQMRPSHQHNMCWQSSKVHSVPSRLAWGVPEAVLSYNHLCQSPCSAFTAAAATEEDAEARLSAAPRWCSGAFSLLLPLAEKQKKTLQYGWYGFKLITDVNPYHNIWYILYFSSKSCHKYSDWATIYTKKYITTFLTVDLDIKTIWFDITTLKYCATKLWYCVKDTTGYLKIPMII